ncbi:unnamed protein product [Macrosiphum euphorbiae]|uniref:Uncharacterized protein n=1 Tax=Macrosiphum euphorbiae TaxID=13131 RepID=A0AAV0VW82_9HEMI|nr:unnamed protein product [Macrosiphum euphorbiae]
MPPTESNDVLINTNNVGNHISGFRQRSYQRRIFAYLDSREEEDRLAVDTILDVQTEDPNNIEYENIMTFASPTAIETTLSAPDQLVGTATAVVAAEPDTSDNIVLDRFCTDHVPSYDRTEYLDKILSADYREIKEDVLADFESYRMPPTESNDVLINTNNEFWTNFGTNGPITTLAKSYNGDTEDGEDTSQGRTGATIQLGKSIF